MGRELKGQEVAKQISSELIQEIASLKKEGIIPTLAVVRVGNKEDDIYYQRSVARFCKTVGISVEEYLFEDTVTEEELVHEIINLNLDEAINGVLILKPLPAHISDHRICMTLDPGKDIDGITDISLAGVMKNTRNGFAPCTAAAVIEILRYFKIDTAGKNAVVIGRSLVVGKPLALMLLSLDATVTVCHTKTFNLSRVASEADILIAAAGRAGMVGADYVKQGAVVIDVGINVGNDGRMTGDVDYDAVFEKAAAITPVPGGVGSVTTAVLAKQLVKAAKNQHAGS